MSGSDGLTLAVVRAIAVADGVEPHELDYSLHDYVATDAVRSMAATDNDDWKLTFEVPDHVVTLHGAGAIAVDGETVHESDALNREAPR